MKGYFIKIVSFWTRITSFDEYILYLVKLKNNYAYYLVDEDDLIIARFKTLEKAQNFLYFNDFEELNYSIDTWSKD